MLHHGDNLVLSLDFFPEIPNFGLVVIFAFLDFELVVVDDVEGGFHVLTVESLEGVLNGRFKLMIEVLDEVSYFKHHHERFSIGGASCLPVI